MRYVVRHDNFDGGWLVVDTLGAEQTVGRHRQRPGAVYQADAWERSWRRLGLGLETFALMPQDADLRVQPG
ncbi:MAG: hypothetical protein VW338_05925 [Rhodospirillaceae bacterium]